MPVGFSSAARNLFLLGSSGAQTVTNFFKTIDQSAGTDGVYLPDEIKYNSADQKYVLSGSASDSNSKSFGWFEKRDGDGTADWDVRVEATTSVDTTLRAMELDANDNLIVVGKTADIPWIAKYSNGGVIDWQSTTNSADVEYTGITSDSNGNYYACGNTPVAGEAQAFVEKFDASGNPGWGKSAFMLGRDVVLNKVAANTRGEVVAAGYLEDDTANKGYIVKIDTNTGEVLWDRTIEDPRKYLGTNLANVQISDVYIDSKDRIYVVGYSAISSSKQFLIKYTAEGNIIWQRETANDINSTGADIRPVNVKSDGETEQTIVASSYVAFGFAGILLSKYSKDGSLVWRRMVSTSYLPAQLHSINLDADPSFYYLLYTDDIINSLNGTPSTYTFGKVSSSGNGLGYFVYEEGTGEEVYYQIDPLQDELGRLTDGSVRQDSSDLITYPFSPNKILFDDLATQVSNKKRQMDTADSFEYSGSPAIRPADFQELNLLGDVYSGSGNWLDQSGKGNDGVVNGATYNAAGYWEFDGVNDKIILPENIYTSGDISVEGWSWNDTLTDENNIFNIEDTNKGVVLLSSGSNGGYGVRWLVRNGSFSGSTNQSNIQTGTGVTGEWHHYVGVWNSTTGEAKVYVDGVLAGTDTNINSVGLNFAGGIGNGIEIGPSASRGRWHDGRVGEVRVYPRVLTAAQVFQNYNATKTKYTGEPPDIAPKITDSPIVYDSSLLLNYDFGNKATYETRPYLLPSNQISSTEQKITASDAVAGDQFGRSVAVGYNKIIVGRQQSSTLQGAVYIYDLDGTNEVKITASDGGVGDQFGYSVAVGSNKIVVGAFGSEAIYIYDLDGTNEVKVTTSDSGATAYTGYGYSVAVGSNKIVVGAMNYSPTIGNPVGAAYVYDLDGTNEIKITASDGDRDDRFGQAVAVGDNKIVVGANQDDDKSGSAYIYDLDGTNEIKITASDVVSDNYFGRAVAVGSNRIVVGAYNGDTDNVYNCGAIYIFDLDGNQLAKITASDAAYFDQFGWVVAIASNRIVVGAPYKEALGGSRPGAAYILDLDGNELAKITASDGANDDRFALGIAAGDNKILVGAYFDDDDGNNSGSAYIYNLSYPLPTTVKNLSSSSYTGTINGATFNSAGYFEFDGSLDYISVPQSDPLDFYFLNNGFPVWTMEVWIYRNSAWNTSWWQDAILACDDGSGSTGKWIFSYDGSLMFHSNTTGGDNRTDVAPRNWTVTTGQWYHVVVSGSTTGVDFYQNLEYLGSSHNGSYTNAVKTAPLTIGYGEGNSVSFDGRIGGVRLYNRKLSGSEICKNYLATRGNYGNPSIPTTPWIGLDMMGFIQTSTNTAFSQGIGNGSNIDHSFMFFPSNYNLTFNWNQTTYQGGTSSIKFIVDGVQVFSSGSPSGGWSRAFNAGEKLSIETIVTATDNNPNDGNPGVNTMLVYANGTRIYRHEHSHTDNTP